MCLLAVCTCSPALTPGASLAACDGGGRLRCWASAVEYTVSLRGAQSGPCPCVSVVYRRRRGAIILTWCLLAAAQSRGIACPYFFRIPAGTHDRHAERVRACVGHARGPSGAATLARGTAPAEACPACVPVAFLCGCLAPSHVSDADVVQHSPQSTISTFTAVAPLREPTASIMPSTSKPSIWFSSSMSVR